MKGDLSRDTFRRSSHFSAVRLQQGRVVTDADWNEQADLARHVAEVQALDVIGECGAPLGAAGYRLVAQTHASAVAAIDASQACVCADDGALLRTADGGQTWTLVDTYSSACLRGVALAGPVGWAVGDSGTLRKTIDAGVTWIAQDAGTWNRLNGVAVFDANHAWAVGDGGEIVATSDGGGHWTRVRTDSAQLLAIAFVDASSGLAVGRGGAILRTSDGGQHWTPCDSGTAAHLRCLAIWGASLAWAAGRGGKVLRSTDGGTHWAACTTPQATTLNAIGFVSATEGWAVGDGGVIFHSTDGGATWALQASAVTAAWRGLSLASGSGWAVGDDASLLRLPPVSTAPAPVLPAVGLSIEPGRCYVHGRLCELDERCSLANQPDGGGAQRLGPGTYMIYLDAWERHVISLQEPVIREVALNGPDTATRSQRVAQVRALQIPAANAGNWTCGAALQGWDDLVGAVRPRLAARAEPQLAPAGLCEIAARAGYRRLENQLYRVEVHQGGSNPSFKWSRENGAVVYAVTDVDVDSANQQTVVRVAARGRDTNLDLSPSDRVELIDDGLELLDRAGTLLRYMQDGDDELELVLAGVPPLGFGQRRGSHPLLRRWDQRPGAASTHALPVVADTWIELEDGVQIRFELGGTYRAGDYWQIPARSFNADVEWPLDEDGDPVAQEPAGIADVYGQLGVVQVDAQGHVSVQSDCRQIFPPLTASTGWRLLQSLSGDGQSAPPGTKLPFALEVRVTQGGRGVAGAPLRCTVEQGGGQIVAPIPALSGADGEAAVDWQLGSSGPQRLRVELLDATGQAVQRVSFNASVELPLDCCRCSCLCRFWRWLTTPAKAKASGP